MIITRTKSTAQDPKFNFKIEDNGRTFYGSGCTVWYEKLTTGIRRCSTIDEITLTDNFMNWKFQQEGLE